MSATEKPILDLRRQIDEIDAALQDLIIRRTSVVEEIAHLKDNGAALRGPIVDDGPIRLAFFGDPDGNDLYFCELKK